MIDSTPAGREQSWPAGAALTLSFCIDGNPVRRPPINANNGNRRRTANRIYFMPQQDWLECRSARAPAVNPSAIKDQDDAIPRFPA